MSQEVKLSNGAVRMGWQALQTLCAPINRLPVQAGMDADRSRRSLTMAVAPFEWVRQQLVADHGKQQPNGTSKVDPDMPGWEEFAVAYNAAASEEVTLEIWPIRMADVLEGFSREDGKRGPLDISPQELGVLRELGIVVD
jgi:hypothetical protein